MAAQSTGADLLCQLSVELTEEERIAVSLRLGLGFLDQGLGVGHDVRRTLRLMDQTVRSPHCPCRSLPVGGTGLAYLQMAYSLVS